MNHVSKYLVDIKGFILREKKTKVKSPSKDHHHTKLSYFSQDQSSDIYLEYPKTYMMSIIEEIP